MWFRVLGPVEIEAEGEVLVLPRRRDRCLLATLLLELGRMVTIDRLAELLWDGEPPERARRIIHGHVSRIRAVLAGADAAEHGVELVSAGNGYRIDADPDIVDAHRFRRLVDEARTLSEPAERAGRLQRALDLWRGPALHNAATDWLRDRLCADLYERRLVAFEDLLSDSLALGRHRAVLPELARITTEYPGREHLVGLHMRALVQVGRKADALEVYHRCREFLSDELGLDPGTALQDLYRAILCDHSFTEETVQGDPSGVPVRSPASPATAGAVPRQLPADVSGFTGRTSYLARLDELSHVGDDRRTAAVIAAITGSAGTGKTTLAVHWAHQAADHFPDGQLYLNLRGFGPGVRRWRPGQPSAPSSTRCRYPSSASPPGWMLRSACTAACWRAAGC